MKTFIILIAFILIVICAYFADKRYQELNEEVGRIIKRLATAEMRLNALLEKIGDDDENMGR